MSTQQQGNRDQHGRTVEIVEECLTAIDADRLMSDFPQAAERAELTDRVESGLNYIEFSDLASDCYAEARWKQADPPGASPTSSPQLGEYLLVREIGRGGMGVVYEAVQPALARRVALKILPYSRTLDPRQLLRFRNESLAAARLDHPNIVRVISVGHDGDMHYYAMQYVEGESLAGVLAKMRRTERQQDDSTQFAAISQGMAIEPGKPHEGEPTSSPTVGPDFFRRVAQWGVQAADGLEHAHAVGVIHRDIKPSNLLLDSNGRILIADFGVALMQNAPELTLTGDLLGTARYMSPEQWQGKPGLVDHRSDIYSLGATLYELLTLCPVLQGDDREHLHRQIVDETPPAPRNLVNSIPRDLETIVLKSLSKDRDERYATAQEMADDLRRFLNDHPIRARRPTLLQRLFRWTRRHRTLVAVAVLILALVAVGLAISTSIVLMQRDQIQTTLAKNRQLLEEARAAQQNAALANHGLRQHLYSVNIRLAYRAWHTADMWHAGEMLREMVPGKNQIDYRGIEWYLLWQRLHAHEFELTGHDDEVYATAFSPDGKWLATAGKDARVCLWNAATGELKQAIEAHSSDVNGLAFRADGRQLATASEDGVVRLFHVDSGKLERELRGHAQGVFSVRYAADSDLLVSGGRGGHVRMWDTSDYSQIASFPAHQTNIESLDISPDGTLLATASRDDTVRLWDLPSGARVATLEGHHDTVLAVAFSPDGTHLATAGEDQRVLLWSVPDRKIVKQMQGHHEWIQSISFAGDGAVIVSASKDSTVRLWEASTGNCLDVLRGHRGRVWNLAVSPDGQRLATAGADGAVKLWRWPAVTPHGSRPTEGRPFMALAVSPDGEQCAVGDNAGNLLVCDPSTGHVLRRIRAHDNACHQILFVAEGKMLVTAGDDRRLRLWNAATGELQHELGQFDEPIQSLRLHPSGDEIICLSGDGARQSTLRVWPVGGKPEELTVVEAPIGAAERAEFTPEGRWLVLGKPDGELVAVDWFNRRMAYLWHGHDTRISQISFNSIGTLLATSEQDGLIKIWSWPDCQLKHVLHGHSKTVRAMAFTSDGRTLASGGDDGVARLWSIATGQELTMLERFDDRVESLAMLPNDRGLIAITGSPQADALVSWFTDATAWPYPLLKAASETEYAP